MKVSHSKWLEAQVIQAVYYLINVKNQSLKFQQPDSESLKGPVFQSNCTHNPPVWFLWDISS